MLDGQSQKRATYTRTVGIDWIRSVRSDWNIVRSRALF